MITFRRKLRRLMLLCLVIVCLSLAAYQAEMSSRWISRIYADLRLAICSSASANSSQQQLEFDFGLVPASAGCDTADTPDACSTDRPPTPSPTQKIPKILHQTFATTQVFMAYKDYIESCLRLNPDWKYYLWTDADIDLLIKQHYPHLAYKFKQFRHRLEKSDAARYLVLHKFGGIYIDMDVECKKSFFPALEAYQAFIDQENVIQAQIVWNRSFSAMNSGMGAIPGHPFFNRTIAELLKVQKFGEPVSSTGPGLLTRALTAYWNEGQAGGRYPVHLLPDYVMSPLLDAVQNYPGRCNSLQTQRNEKQNPKVKIKKQSILATAREKLNTNATLFEYEKGCLKMAARRFKLDSDIGPNTIAIHRFRHLGYPQNARLVAKRVFNAATHFAKRIHFFSNEQTGKNRTV